MTIFICRSLNTNLDDRAVARAMCVAVNIDLNDQAGTHSKLKASNNVLTNANQNGL